MALTNYYGSIEDRKNYLTGNTFENGVNLKFCLKNSKIMGSIGIVTSEISVKNEGYITEIIILDKSQQIFEEMLDDALAICRNTGAHIITIGLKPHNFFLTESVEGYHFIRSYSFIKLIHNKRTSTGYDNLVPLNKENAPIYAEIMTSSFINSPNGASISIKEAYELLYEPESNKYGLLKVDSNYVGVYEFRITDNKGWLDSIGIKPSCQNKGYGKILLDQSISYLYSLGVDKIELIVADSNIHAYNLYLKTGFIEKEVLSTWYKLFDQPLF
jgi:ribosomal protein S18 acetylase RimI-like enzyme